MDTITYYQKYKKCGKENCQVCRSGPGHGPYWFYSEKVDGRTRESYGGRQNPFATDAIGRRNQGPLIGREGEQAQIIRLLQSVKRQFSKEKRNRKNQVSLIRQQSDPEPQFILLEGEAGIGKTRLAEEVARQASKQGWLIATSSAYAQEEAFPYHIWSNLLRKALALYDTQRREIKPEIYQSLKPLLPELEGVASAKLDQFHLWNAVAATLLMMSIEAPLLLVLDDIQWFDSSSSDLLAYLIRRLRGSSILIMGTCRDSELRSDHPFLALLIDLEREQSIVRIPLALLTDQQISALASSLTPLSDTLIAQICQQAAGNPYFAEELVRMVPPSAAPASPPALNTPSSLPRGIRGLFDQRLQMLSLSCRQILNQASVLGHSFELPLLLKTMVESHDILINENTIIDGLEEALEAGILTEEKNGQRISYRFWHPLLVQHLYESLSAPRRANWHRRAAEALSQVSQNTEEELAATILFHLRKYDASPMKIMHYAQLAGNRAASLFAFPQAEQYYRIAIQASEQVRVIEVKKAPVEEFALLLESLAECMRVQGKPDEASLSYEQALQIHEHHLSTHENRQELHIQAMLWCELGQAQYDLGKNEFARQHYQHGEQVLREAGETSGAALAALSYQSGRLAWRDGFYDEAQQAAHKALVLFEEAVGAPDFQSGEKLLTRIRRTLAGDPADIGRTHALIGVIASSSGRSTEAMEHLERARVIYEQQGCLREVAIVCCDLGDLFLRRAEYTQAQSYLLRCAQIAEQIGDMPLLTFATGNLGIVDHRLGALARAEDQMRKTVQHAQQRNDEVALALWNAYLARVLIERGLHSEAGILLKRALQLARTTQIPAYIAITQLIVAHLRISQARLHEHLSPETSMRFLKHAKRILNRVLCLEGIEVETQTEALVLLAHVEALIGEEAEAHTHVSQAREQAEQTQQPGFLACAYRILANLHRGEEEKETAFSHIEHALGIFDRLGMRLEFARTLSTRGVFLCQNITTQNDMQRGLKDLHDARQIFSQCQSAIDLQLIETYLGSEPLTLPTV